MMDSLYRLYREYENPATQGTTWGFIIGALTVLSEIDQRLTKLENQDGEARDE